MAQLIRNAALRSSARDSKRSGRKAVASYAAGRSKKDIVFDDPFPAVTNALAFAGDAKSLKGSSFLDEYLRNNTKPC